MTEAVTPLADLKASLIQNLSNPAESYWDDILAKAEMTLATAIDAGDEDQANHAWFLRTVAEARGRFVKCFNLILQNECYKAWCEFEKVEIALPWLIRNPFLDTRAFEVEKLIALVRQWQSLFPYKVFFSPGYIHKHKECTICLTAITPWTSCEHERGRVYGGRECLHRATITQILEISLVLDPVQKYSVGFVGKDANGKSVDHHDYSIVRFLADRLPNPFDGWRIHWTEAYHPHTLFPLATPEGPCPCESGRSYKSCCLPKRGVIRPHAQFGFEKEPPRELPNAAFAGYGEQNGPAALRRDDSEPSTVATAAVS